MTQTSSPPPPTSKSAPTGRTRDHGPSYVFTVAKSRDGKWVRVLFATITPFGYQVIKSGVVSTETMQDLIDGKIERKTFTCR